MLYANVTFKMFHVLMVNAEGQYPRNGVIAEGGPHFFFKLEIES